MEGRRIPIDDLSNSIHEEKYVLNLSKWYTQCIFEKCVEEYFNDSKMVKYWDTEIAKCKHVAEIQGIYNKVVEEVRKIGIPIETTGCPTIKIIEDSFNQAIDAL